MIDYKRIKKKNQIEKTNNERTIRKKNSRKKYSSFLADGDGD